MPGYIQAALPKYNHPLQRPLHALHPCWKPNYGAKQQFAPPQNTLLPLDQSAIKRIKKITGMLLYYVLTINSTILTALVSVALQQSKATTTTKQSIAQLLDCCHTHPNAKVQYKASDMILQLYSNAAFQSEAQAYS